MKHIFEIGSNLLCFEPDETKEKLIYHARVINHNGFETKGKTKLALYLVHFLGWSKKWDRVVSENLLLPLSDFNINLKEKIESIAKNEKRHQLRHDLIDEVLEVASKASNENKFDWNDLEKKLEIISNQFKQEKRAESSVKELSVKEESESGKDHISVTKSVGENCELASETENSQLQKENDFIHATFSPKISLTEQQLNLLLLDKSLNSKLTYPAVTSVDDLDKSAWSPCVVDILQNYVDAFPVLESRLPGWKEFDRFYELDQQEGFLDRIENSPTSILDLSFDFNERNASTARKQFKLPQWPDSELNGDYQRADLSSQLCFEVCSGLRILFDFYARHLLLYENELHHCDAADDTIAATATAARHRDSGPRFVAAEMMSLQLLPDEYRHHRHSFQPSLFFGLPHLLRLLYKLPMILVRMGLTRCALAIVLRHCYSLIKFLDMTFSEVSAVSYQRQLVTTPLGNRGGCANSKVYRRKRASSRMQDEVAPMATTIAPGVGNHHEPRILLRRLELFHEPPATIDIGVTATTSGTSSSQYHHQDEPRVIVTRSSSRCQRK